MDKVTYKYLETLILISGGGQGSAAPANPTTNLSNDALGYFGAFSKSAFTATVK